MLEKDLAGVRLEEHEHEKGVVVLIPAGIFCDIRTGAN
jgi:hypothetical protein